MNLLESIKEFIKNYPEELQKDMILRELEDRLLIDPYDKEASDLYQKLLKGD